MAFRAVILTLVIRSVFGRTTSYFEMILYKLKRKFTGQEERYYVAKANGSFAIGTTADAEVNSLIVAESNHQASTIKLDLYTNANKISPMMIDPRNTETLRTSTFEPSNPTKIIIHGYGGNYRDDIILRLRDAFLSIGNFNILCVDWSSEFSVNYLLPRASVNSWLHSYNRLMRMYYFPLKRWKLMDIVWEHMQQDSLERN